MTIGNTTEPIGTELISENIVLPIVINGNTYYIQLFTNNYNLFQNLYFKK